MLHSVINSQPSSPSPQNGAIHHKKVLPRDEDVKLSHIKQERMRSPVPDFAMSHFLNDEISYLYWFQDIEENLQLYPQFNPYFVLDKIPLSGYTLDYQDKVKKATAKCIENPDVNQYLNFQLYNSINQSLHYLVGDKTFIENFEAIKFHFHQTINPFYLMTLEHQLSFDLNNILKFLTDLDNLTKVYTLTFQRPPTNELKLEWIMRCLNHYSDISREIQLNWEQINKDPILIRRILTKYANSRMKLRKRI
ncbi:uncharacterized protein SPAPADRAFT_59508 [Spathaspora passalidarum NRRL Y-27907]|uniref:Uncharacterized protein n=1 Tax=Spathaspora passalidarum (strain NRRL Y-27907 / 11-Y1) TaxID=619300 RepID=G3AHC2_SPAPN|nr:uncharacterized protein SPAPADRAFT_59508 [Spathaspora passalidarum NRRL Y-27907]EGW34086.1 hypothetical protein SPAPADRAFT_59508 [Spathaspora passalidarum NRRL Y-27907]